jgi:predicted P-loop ATPase
MPDVAGSARQFNQLDLIAAAKKLWGEPTSSDRNEMRFGARGSKAIRLDDLTWFDHEAQEGGGTLELMMRAGIRPAQRHEAEIRYDYRDEHGTVLFQVVKRPWLPKAKRFTQRAADGKGGWIEGKGCMKGVRRVLYRLPELMALNAVQGRSPTVFLCEGEKDAENLIALGLAATTNPGGAGKWREEYAITLAGHDVVILPDNDAVGIDHANAAAASLRMIGRSVKIVRLPGLEEHGDVSDWIGRGGTGEMLRELVRATPEGLAEWAQLRPPPRPGARRANGAAAPGPGWLADCSTGRHGAVLMTVENAYIGMTNDPGLKDAVGFDEMSRFVTVAHAPGEGGDTQGFPRNITDNDYTMVQRYLQHAGLKTVGIGVVRQAVDEYAGRNSYHPVRTMLEGLTWDRTERLETWLINSFGIADNDYHRTIGKLFVVAMVARIFEPGCKADYMLVLEGEQGEEKSKLCEALAGKDYFSDHLPDITSNSKDASQHLRGRWLIEISEMHAFNRAESTQLKQFITRTVERYRPPYGHAEVNEPRQCLFIGTTNKAVYLKDETGGRRFWPLKTGTVNLDWMLANRDQILAEAVHFYREGCPWWPGREDERAFIRPEQEARYDADAWEEPIAKWLDDTTQKDVTVMEVAQAALGYGGEGTPVNRMSRTDQNRIMAVLTALGWERAPRQMTRRAWRQGPQALALLAAARKRFEGDDHDA